MPRLGEGDLASYARAAEPLWRIVHLAQSARLFGTVGISDNDALALADAFLKKVQARVNGFDAVQPRCRELSWSDLRQAERRWLPGASPIDPMISSAVLRAEEVVLGDANIRSLVVPPLWPVPGQVSIVSEPLMRWPPHGASTADPKILDVAWGFVCTVEKHVRHALLCELASLHDPSWQFLIELVELHHGGVVVAALDATELTMTHLPPLL
jgi:hypothetical protein